MCKFLRVFFTLFLSSCLMFSALVGVAEATSWQPMSDQDWVEMLYGSWQASEPMGRGYGRRAMFGEDICFLLPDDEESVGDAFEGNYWTVVDGILEIHHGEGEVDDVLILPLTWVMQNDSGLDDQLYEVMFGDTIMYRYMDEMDQEIDLDMYSIHMYFDEMDWEFTAANGFGN